MIQARNRHILYVDDTEEQRYAMRRILEAAGYVVIEAGTGGEALRILQTPESAARIHLVVLDVKLPDMSGYEVCRRIKAAPLTASIPVLQVSASFADPTLRAAGLSGGADAYVAQPVHPNELLALVHALIRSFDSERTLRFQAQVSSRITASLDYAETLATIEQVFLPSFADACYILLRAPEAPRTEPDARSTSPRLPDATVPTNHESATPTPAELLPAAIEVCNTGESILFDANNIIVPLEVGPRRLGALTFHLGGDLRRYTLANLSLAEDLADRAALALQNAILFSAQQAAQAALVQSEKLAAAGRLSAAIAHEINNPLESITNLMYLIDTSDEITPTLKGYVQEALSELSRLTHIARQSLGFYRELTGPATFDLNESVESTLSIYLKRFGSKHIVVERCFHPGGMEVFAVKGEIRQVISNLLVNAYDALPAHGILRVETTLHPGDPDSMDGQTGPSAVLRVIDNGSGMEPDVAKRIFEPFFTTKQGIGTGLGLWVSETIIEKHGGSLRVASQTATNPDLPGRTVFEVILPTALPTSAETVHA